MSARTKEGLAKARRQGTRSGKPIGRPPEAIDPKVINRIKDMHTREGLSAYAIAQRLTGEVVPTPRGGTTWYQTTVRDILAREERRELEDAS